MNDQVGGRWQTYHGNRRSSRRLVVRIAVGAFCALVALYVPAVVGPYEHLNVAVADAAGAARAKELCDAMVWPASFPPRGAYTGTTEEPSITYPGSTTYEVTYQGGICHVILTNIDLAIKHGPHPRPLNTREC